MGGRCFFVYTLRAARLLPVRLDAPNVDSCYDYLVLDESVSMALWYGCVYGCVCACARIRACLSS